MKKKFLGRVLTMLLVASMVFTLLPASAIAAGNWWWNADEYTEEALPAATADNSYQYNIFFLDCGRKYFSVENIEKMIDNAAAAGFNYIQLAVGNDGLRLLLDDMELKVNGTPYGSDAVKAAIQAGNRAYNAGFKEKDGHKTYVPEKNELTEGEMSTIIAYAKSKGMGVIPCVNTPGHMDAILSAATSLTDTNCSYNGSARTIDVTNTTAVAFTKALLQKYIAYFRSQGCQLFNMGADEYANDVYTTGGMGFAHLKSQRQYVYYVNYINAVATMIEDAGMTPMAFNDGIYYGGDKSTTINKNIVICYWSSGWIGYEVRSAKNLVDDGFTMINTHGDYYYVLGKSDKYDEFGVSYASGFNRYNFIDGSTIQQPAGSMLCVWCDYPGDEDEATILSNTPDIIKNFGSTLPKLNTTPVQPDTGITIKPEGGATGKLDSTKNESIVLDAGKVVTWSYDPSLVTLTSADAPSDVALAEFATLRAQRVTVMPVAGASGTATITAADDDGHSATFPIEVVNSAASTGVTVDLKVGQTSDTYTVDGDVTGQVDTTGYDAKVATYQATPRTETTSGGEEKTTYLDGQEFYIKDSEGKYFNVNAKWGDKDTTGKTTTWIGRTQNNAPDEFYLQSASDSKKYIECKAFGNWAVSNSQTSKFTLNAAGKLTSVYTGIITYTLGTPYKNVPGSSTEYTDITFHGVAEGTTYVTIGGTKYTINVTDKAPDGTLAGDAITLEHWITNAKVGPEEGSKENATVISKTEPAVSSDEGLEIKSKAFATGYWDSTVVTYWQAVRLDSAHKQTTENGTDQTAAGTVLTHIRYHGGAWQYKTLGGVWTYFQSDDQLVAYYLQEKTVTPEVTTYFKDYGYGTDTTTPYDENGQVALTVAVVYPDGTVSPAEGEMYSKSTTIFNYWGNRDIGIVSTANNEDYTISKITVTDGTRASNTTENQWYTSDTINWKKKEVEGGTAKWYDEKVVWDEVTNAGTTPMANGSTHKDYCTWTEKNTAKLVLIYLKPVEKETNLNLVYHDKTDNQDIKSSQIVMKYTQGSAVPTYFNSLYNGGTVNQSTGVVTGGTLIAKDNKTAWPGKTASEADYLPDAAYVVNSANVAQHFNKEIARIPGVAPKYQSGFYKYDGAEISADGKTLTLHYVIDDTKLENQYVIDFGLPLHIPLRELVTNEDRVEAVYANGTMLSGDTDYTAQHGTLRYDAAAKEIIYKRTATFSDDTISTASFQVKYTGDTTLSKTFTIGVLPASNVLYEASFLEQVSKDNGPAWKAPATTTRTQQTQKVGDTTTTYNVFGRDKAYDSAYGALGAWTASGLDFKSRTRALTTSFYGNGFDLIGNCGPKTGRVILFVKNAETGKGKLVDVDTRYGADTFYQVPLAHVMMAEEASYNVTVYAAGLKATDATPASYSLRGAATYASDYAADSYDAVLNGVLAENGLTMADVEYVKVESAPAAAKSARRATSFYALDTAAETGTVTHEAGDHVEIDGFRVYRSSTNNTNYPEGEKNVQYLNILDAVKNFTAFVEGSGSDTDWTVRTDYENAGGPQNEIYLRKTNGENSAIAFKVDPNAIVQISARAVENKKAATLYVNGNETVIATNTEMYYTVKANERGIVTIKNTGEGMLALGNLKIKNGAQAAALSEEDYPAAIALLSLNAAPETPDTVFEPTISAKVTTTKFIRSKVVTLTVSASADVAKLTVNDKELRPTNGWLVSMGWSKSYNYILTETVKKSETKTYEIIGYSADGTPSTPTVVKSK